MQHKFAVIGGGTAGILTSTYLKKYWGDKAKVTLIYDHSKPGIGVGESLTPAIYDYLNYVGISKEEIIKNVNATVKLGLKFKNWLNDGKYFFHSFQEFKKSSFNFGAGYDIVNNEFDNDTSWGNSWLEGCLIPNKFESDYTESLHFDANLLSRYIEKKFKDELEILDDIVLDTITKENNEIDHLILKNKGKFSADFYIDATGFQSILFKKLNVKWIDKKSWLPLDRCIPNPIEWNFDEIPNYTTSEATDEGWILQVPLQNRWGAGYLFSSEFLDEEKAFEKFSKFVKENYNKELKNTSKVLKFDSGYWEEQWVGNCLAVGLSSGFSEPLEATNIHHTVFQIIRFCQIYNFKNLKTDIKSYNKTMIEMYYNIYMFLRFCYTTGREDSKFWKYMTNNKPDDIIDLENKIKNDLLNISSYPGFVFDYGNFTRVANGLKKIDKESYKNVLINRKAYDIGKEESKIYKKNRFLNLKNSMSHKEYINLIVNK